MVINDLLNGMIQVEGTIFFREIGLYTAKIETTLSNENRVCGRRLFAFGIDYPVILKDSGAL